MESAYTASPSPEEPPLSHAVSTWALRSPIGEQGMAARKLQRRRDARPKQGSRVVRRSNVSGSSSRRHQSKNLGRPDFPVRFQKTAMGRNRPSRSTPGEEVAKLSGSRQHHAGHTKAGGIFTSPPRTVGSIILSRGELEAIAAGAVVSSKTSPYINWEGRSLNESETNLKEEQSRPNVIVSHSGQKTFEHSVLDRFKTTPGTHSKQSQYGRRKRPQSANLRGRNPIQIDVESSEVNLNKQVGRAVYGRGKKSKNRPMSAGSRRRRGPVAITIPAGKLPYNYGPNIEVHYRQTFGVTKPYESRVDKPGTLQESATKKYTQRDESDNRGDRLSSVGDSRHYADEQTVRMSNLIKVKAFRADPEDSGRKGTIPELNMSQVTSFSQHRRRASVGKSRQTAKIGVDNSTDIIESMANKSWSPRSLGRRPESDDMGGAEPSSKVEDAHPKVLYASPRDSRPQNDDAKLPSNSTSSKQPDDLLQEWLSLRDLDAQQSRLGSSQGEGRQSPDPLSKYIDGNEREKFKAETREASTKPNGTGHRQTTVVTVEDDLAGHTTTKKESVAILKQYRTHPVTTSKPSIHSRSKIKRGNTASMHVHPRLDNSSNEASIRIGRFAGRPATPSSIGMQMRGRHKLTPGLALALGASDKDFTNYASRLAGHGILGRSMMIKSQEKSVDSQNKSSTSRIEKVSVTVPFLNTSNDITMSDNALQNKSAKIFDTNPNNVRANHTSETFIGSEDFGGWDNVPGSGGALANPGIQDAFQRISIGSVRNNFTSRNRRRGTTTLRRRSGSTQSRPKSSSGKRKRRRHRKRPKSASSGGRSSHTSDFYTSPT